MFVEHRHVRLEQLVYKSAARLGLRGQPSRGEEQSGTGIRISHRLFTRNRLVGSVVAPLQHVAGRRKTPRDPPLPRALAPSAAFGIRRSSRIECCCRGFRHCSWHVGRCRQRFGRCHRRINGCCRGLRCFAGTDSRGLGHSMSSRRGSASKWTDLDEKRRDRRSRRSGSVHSLVLPHVLLLLCPKPQLPVPSRHLRPRQQQWKWSAIAPEALTAAPNAPATVPDVPTAAPVGRATTTSKRSGCKRCQNA